MFYQEEVADFGLGLCCAEEERGETPGREDSPTDLGEAELDLKAGDDKAFGRNATVNLASASSHLGCSFLKSYLCRLHVRFMKSGTNTT